MPYAVQQDLIDRFGIEELTQLTDRENAQIVDTGVVDRALADAEAEIDGYLAARYTLPLTAVSNLLQLTACNIARYRLYGSATTDEVRNRYLDAVRLLKNIAAGTIVLPGASAQAPAVGGAAVAQRSPAPRFDADTLAGY